MSRRDFLKLAAAAPVSVMVAPAAASTETEMMQLFREWRHRMDCASDDSLSEDEHGAAVDVLCAIEDEIAEARCASASDWVLKVIAITGFGVFGLPGQQKSPAFWDEALALVGEPQR